MEAYMEIDLQGNLHALPSRMLIVEVCWPLPKHHEVQRLPDQRETSNADSFF